jgi:hypothetical protein
VHVTARYAGVFLALIFASCTAKQRPGDLTVAGLFKRGREFDGKRVAAIGYYVAGVEQTCLYSSPEAERYAFRDLLPDGIFPREIWVEPGRRRVSRLTGRYVRVVGTFHYRPQFRREIQKRDDGREFESIITEGYGHMAGSPAEITDVTSFRRLR